MPTEYIYKQQGDGRDSWVKIETDDKGIILSKEMVYENPTVHPLIAQIEKMTPQEREALRTALNK